MHVSDFNWYFSVNRTRSNVVYRVLEKGPLCTKINVLLCSKNNSHKTGQLFYLFINDYSPFPPFFVNLITEMIIFASSDTIKTVWYI